ncbi:hypothetical protein [Luteimonas aquatica]|uniref:hypothetical protein n=1 Tax=Luteimonas aquatica TaxID=450364 RepID=UPI001F58FB94|nr:hypothetical protein [Luteimonas aquatica]
MLNIRTGTAALALALSMIGASTAAEAAVTQHIRYASYSGISATSTYYAWCMPGEIASGGGFNNNYNPNQYINGSYPATNGAIQGWAIRSTNNWTGGQVPSVNITVYAVCLSQ